MTGTVNFQLGKKGLTTGFIDLLKKTFKKHDLVKINILRACSRKKQEVEDMADKICHQLKKSEGKSFTYKLVGYTLSIKKWRKLRRTK
jgi:RNA-binding protein YhbY